MIWLDLLVKAFAKVLGGYRYLEGGNAQEALRMLTGAPMTAFNFSDASVGQLIYDGSMSRLIQNFLAKRSFVIVAHAQHHAVFVKENTGTAASMN